MANSNSPINKLKKRFKERWSQEDMPGMEPRFQVILLLKDVGTYIMLPLAAVLCYQSCSFDLQNELPKRDQSKTEYDEAFSGNAGSSIIHFEKKETSPSKYRGIPKRTPGTLVKVKLLNRVETFSQSPVHVRVLDNSLGKRLRGATIIGNASSSPGVRRAEFYFKFLRHPRRKNVAIPITARALSLDGTFGVAATKKEGFFARAALGAAQNSLYGNAQGETKQDERLKDVLARAFVSGLVGEARETVATDKILGDVLVVKPGEVFFAELTEFFPNE